MDAWESFNERIERGEVWCVGFSTEAYYYQFASESAARAMCDHLNTFRGGPRCIVYKHPGGPAQQQRVA